MEKDRESFLKKMKMYIQKTKFFDTDELTSLTDDFVYWRNIKHIAYEAIKGNKVPSKMKIVFALSKTKYEETFSNFVYGKPYQRRKSEAFSN